MSQSSQPSKWRSFLDGLEERTGYRALLGHVLNEPVPGGARFAYVFGSALLFTFVIQVVTGIALATAYSPSATDAWGSVFHIQNTMTLGWLVRGVHHFGSSAMIVLCVLHMTQVFVYGAYRKPRELNWIIGVVMLLLVLAFGLTGYLLPWDQKGYWATQVATAIMESTPGGGALQTLLQGGSEYGNATLTRFYAIHVFILPISLTLLIIGHVALFRRHGVTVRPSITDEDLSRRGVKTFWPYQVLYDLIFAAVVLAVIVALVVTVGVSLEAPADPASGYEARPEWYFLFLFQLLKYFEGPMAIIGTVVIPGIAIGFLFALPLLDKRGDGKRAYPSRKVAIPFFGLLAGAAALTVVALVNDANSVSFQEGRRLAAEQARLASKLAAQPEGIDAQGRVVLLEGLRLYREKGCESCHGSDDKGADGETKRRRSAPTLADYGSRRRIEKFIINPDDPDFFGRTVFKGQMDPWEGDDADRDAIVSWLMSLSGRPHSENPEIVKRGYDVFSDGDCVSCHNDPKDTPLSEDYSDREGPDLLGYQGYEWVRGVIRNASHKSYFGGVLSPKTAKKAMPPYDDLTNDELDLLVTWLLAGAPGAD